MWNKRLTPDDRRQIVVGSIIAIVGALAAQAATVASEELREWLRKKREEKPTDGVS